MYVLHSAFGAKILANEKEKRIKIHDESRPVSINASECWQTQRVLNFFLAKRKFLLNNPWEDALKLEEHTFFFAAAYISNDFGKNIKIYSCDDVIVHHNIQPGKRSYDVLRKRALKYGLKAKEIFKKRYGYSLEYCVGDCGTHYRRI